MNRDKGRSRRSTGDMTSFEGDDGSFEILIEGEGPSSASKGPGRAATASSGGKKKLLLMIGALLLVGAGAFALVAPKNSDSGKEESGLAFDDSPGFQPYRGDMASGAAQEQALPAREAPRAAAPAVEEETDDEGYDRESDWRIGEHDVIGLEPDGVRIVSDSRGTPMSRKEAQIRAERELNAIENSPTEFERRLHRRDAILHSRVLTPHAKGAKIAPGVQISKDIQKQLLKAVPARIREGQSDENFIGDESEYYADYEGEFENDYDEEFDEEDFIDENDWEEEYP